MANFPLLQSGAVCQYPAQVNYQQGVEVLRYLDGSDQRFLRQGRQFRRWEIRLDFLSQGELIALEDFFNSQLGDYSLFDFLDPFSGRVVPNCCFGEAQQELDYFDITRGATSLWVVETNV